MSHYALMSLFYARDVFVFFFVFFFVVVVSFFY